jgi:hypothetical protein
MKDLQFDFELMDITDLSLVDDCSEQNSAMFLITKNSNVNNPLLGVGITGIREGNLSDLTNKLNVWRRQVTQDGATNATFKINTNGTFAIASKY